MLMVLWLSLKEMDMVIQVQNLNEAVCISHSANTLSKDMHPNLLLPAIGK